MFKINWKKWEMKKIILNLIYKIIDLIKFLNDKLKLTKFDGFDEDAFSTKGKGNFPSEIKSR